MWAAVLVPMWLRRHDASLEARSADRFSTAMRVLSRRALPLAARSTTSKRYVVMPRRLPDAMSWHVSGASDPARRARQTRPEPAPEARPAPSRGSKPGRPTPAARTTRPVDARRALMARRRRVLLVLLSLVALSLVLVVVGVLPWLVQLVVDVLLVAYVAHLRIEARTAVRRPVRRVPARPAPARPAPARPAPPVPAEQPEVPAYAPAASSGGSVVGPDVEPVVADAPVEEVATGADGWQPVPVPPPTYTLKPPALPVIDLTRPGAWSDALLDDDPVVEADDWDDEDDELDHIVERRAVGD